MQFTRKYVPIGNTWYVFPLYCIALSTLSSNLQINIVIQNNFQMDLMPETVNKCANFKCKKLNYKFCTVLFINTASNATRTYLTLSQWMPAGIQSCQWVIPHSAFTF